MHCLLVSRLRRFASLLKVKPEHPETKMLAAELNIAAENFPQARRALGDLPTTHPTARSLAIMAAIERGEGASEAIVRGWLARAVTAKRGPQWICENCNHIHVNWHPICENCAAFDTLEWKEPPETEAPMPNGAEMLPLLVGPMSAQDAEVVSLDEIRPQGPTRPPADEPVDAEIVDGPPVRPDPSAEDTDEVAEGPHAHDGDAQTAARGVS